MTLDAPSPQLTQMLLDLLNKRITPVVQSRGTVGEGDLALMGNIGAVMVGVGRPTTTACACLPPRRWPRRASSRCSLSPPTTTP